MRNPLYPRWTLLLALLLSATPLRAEDLSGRFGFGGEAAAMKLMGGERDYSDVNPNFALHLRYGLRPALSVELAAKALWSRPAATAPGDETGFEWKATEELYTSIWQLRAGLLYHFLPQRALSPYLGLGLGATSLRVKDMRGQGDFGGLFPGGPILEGYDSEGRRQKLDATHLSGTVAAGFEWFVHPRFALALGGRYHFFPGNDLDNVGLSGDDFFGAEYVDANTGLAELQLGFTWFFGHGDRDGDGLNDKVDRCPEAAEDIDGFQDEDGCPDPDNDGDGLPDEFDRCPESAEDVDGYQDADGCPDLDNDGDGIPDLKDACPGAAEDRDGFQDADGCPDPDNDGDGVPDHSDVCPDTPAGAVVDARGCPEPATPVEAPPVAAAPAAEPVVEIKGALILEGVHFITGSAELAPDSRVVLDSVARSLLAYPAVRIEIQGHTDSAGSAAYNEALSLRRAEAVRDYLVHQGVEASRLRAVGYGERFPIASNSTPEGQAENRRVEVHRIGE